MPRIVYPLLLAVTLFAAPLAADEEQDMIATAEQGDAIDQADLGTAYFHGNGVPQDFRKAYIWYAVAAEGGFEEAVERRDKTAAKLTPAELEQARAEAAALLEKLK
jgi:hypothetical protein